MSRIFTAGLVAVLLASSVQAQDTAAIDPDAGAFTSVASVVGQCELVAEEISGTADGSGPCIGATQSFLAALDGTAPEVADQSITELVVALVPLAQADEACNFVDTEIAEAIRLAASYASTADQAARINEIAATVAACDTGATAAIDPLQSEEVSPG